MIKLEGKKKFKLKKVSYNEQIAISNSRYEQDKTLDNRLNMSKKEQVRLKLDDNYYDRQNKENKEKDDIKNLLNNNCNYISTYILQKKQKNKNIKDSNDYYILNKKNKIQITARDKINVPEIDYINLIKWKKNILLKQKEKSEQMIRIVDKVIKEYENDPSNDNYKNIMNVVDEIEYKICYNYELNVIGKQDLKNIKKNDQKALLKKIALMEKKIALINNRLDINLTGKEIKINLNGKNVTNIDLELLCGINFKYLEEMNLGNNNISNLDQLKNLDCPNLKVLILNNNKIKDVSPL